MSFWDNPVPLWNRTVPFTVTLQYEPSRTCKPQILAPHKTTESHQTLLNPIGSDGQTSPSSTNNPQCLQCSRIRIPRTKAVSSFLAVQQAVITARFYLQTSNLGASRKNDYWIDLVTEWNLFRGIFNGVVDAPASKWIAIRQSLICKYV